MLIYLSIIIAIVILIYIIYNYLQTQYNDKIINTIFGFWSSTDARCKEMQIDYMIMMFGKKINNNTFNVSIISGSNNNFILAENTLATITINRIENEKIYGNIYFEKIENKEFPNIQNIIYDTKINKITLYGNNNLYCEIYKNSYYSEIIDDQNNNTININQNDINQNDINQNDINQNDILIDID